MLETINQSINQPINQSNESLLSKIAYDLLSLHKSQINQLPIEVYQKVRMID